MSFSTTAARLIRRFAPKTARHLVRASYEAAGTGRRLSQWRPGSVGPNQAIVRDLATLRERSRESMRNNGWVTSGQTNWVSNEIGAGIMPQPTTPDETFNRTAKELWDDWTAVADADNLLDFYGLLALAVRERRESGEVFIRLRPRRLSDGLPAPFQVQLLEAEHCPETHNDSAKNIRAGIQFSPIGARSAYWMYREHPGDAFNSTINNFDLVAVPASSILHHYAPLRAGQLRGVPWTVQALIKAKDFDEYDDAELVRKKNRAAFTGAIQRREYDENDYKFDPITGTPIDKDSAGVPVSNVESGTFFATLPGEEVNLFDGDTTGSGYADFVRQQLLGFASSQGIPYEFITGDMSKVNDRLMRVILNEYHRVIEQTQWHLTIPQICYPIWAMFIDLAVFAGNLSAPGYAQNPALYHKVSWKPHRWPYINPLQDVQAATLEIRAGLQSRSGAASERGLSAEEIDTQNAEDKKRAEGLGLDYETHSGTSGAPAQDDDEELTEEDRQAQQARLLAFRRANREIYAAAR